MTAPVEDSEDEEKTFDFELRADHVSDSVLRDETVTDDLFDRVHKALVDRSMCLVVGPRGCGKTHMMRYTWLRCIEDNDLPLAIYVSFNRYLRLEPFLHNRANGITYFQIWMLVRILVAIYDVLERMPNITDFDPASNMNVSLDDVKAIVVQLERAAPLSDYLEGEASKITIDGIGDLVGKLCQRVGRKRSVLLLDDAAISLTPEFMVGFFETVKDLKRKALSPKCSVYPGTTEYGPRFHARQEATEVEVWLATDSPGYREIMSEIGAKRFGPAVEKINVHVREQLMYAAFGMPRAYLTLLHDFSNEKGQTQQALNSVIERHRQGISSEYQTLGLKMPQFKTVVEAGFSFFEAAVKAIREANGVSTHEKQLLIGVESSDFSHLTTRMIKFLIEAGLLYESTPVKHGGPDRTYRRFTPHLAALMAVRAFAGGKRGQSSADVVQFLSRHQAKHPVRRKLETLLGKRTLETLHLDLPPCQKCHSPRQSEDSKFCNICGSRLFDTSTFTRLLGFPINDVPSLTEFQRAKVAERNIKTIGDLLAYEDPGTELRQAYGIGPARSVAIIQGVHGYIDEFLS